ncbi:serine carboxypeptidase [Calocera viscosa TUFC12733]|uniref:carboxypeptidase C n=1 Tax=Calocera viscosa (strain TUFC12733) TaxID=1330018 RepID=A0A167MCZ9_CALVF|nr:serine carboxypeptidase [Calocera viscosa TUFC12733]
MRALAIPVLSVLVAGVGAVRMPHRSAAASYGSASRTSEASSSPPALGHPSSLLLNDESATFTSGNFPGHAVRIRKNTGWCDPDVKSWTGYIDINEGTKHLFFYFFESRRSPSCDPLLMWVDGGPGCSGALGLFMELGPCGVDEHGTGTLPRKDSWNEQANVIFLDQPVGAGYSYAEGGEGVDTTEEAARDVAAFVGMFMETFEEYSGREFHMAGKSYAGRYLPVFASEIVDQNKRAAAKGRQEINLKSIMIGNGITDFFAMLPSRYDIPCTGASVPPILDISQCVRMKEALPRCVQMTKASCVDVFNELGCKAAKLFCDSELEAPLVASGRNIYDISKECEGTRELLGADGKVKDFELCSNHVWKGFNRQMDVYAPGPYYVAGLLERGVSVLNYAGTYDWTCNWIGNMQWVETLDWYGKEAYNSQTPRQWLVDGERAGITKSWKGLTYATLEGAGHLAPHDKPVQALAMVNRWLEQRAL